MTTIPDTHHDLLKAQFATFATVGAGEIPQQTVIWFLCDDGELKLSLNGARVKTRNLRTRPGCSLLILDPENAYRYLEVRGTARVEADDDYVFADKVGAKYGSDLRAHDKPGEHRVVVTIEPSNVYAVDMSG